MENSNNVQPVVKSKAKEKEKEMLTEEQLASRDRIFQAISKANVFMLDEIKKEVQKSKFDSNSKVYADIKNRMTMITTTAKKFVDVEQQQMEMKKLIEDM